MHALAESWPLKLAPALRSPSATVHPLPSSVCGAPLQGVTGAADPLDAPFLVAGPQEVLEPVGSVLSVMDDVVVVQGLANSRAVTEG